MESGDPSICGCEMRSECVDFRFYVFILAKGTSDIVITRIVVFSLARQALPTFLEGRGAVRSYCWLTFRHVLTEAAILIDQAIDYLFRSFVHKLLRE